MRPPAYIFRSPPHSLTQHTQHTHTHTHTHTQTSTVACGELSIVVMTENNSFLIWAHRPVIRSPLTEVLMQSEDKDTVPELSSPKAAARPWRSGSLVNETLDVVGFGGSGLIPVDANSFHLPGSGGHVDSG